MIIIFYLDQSIKRCTAFWQKMKSFLTNAALLFEKVEEVLRMLKNK